VVVGLAVVVATISVHDTVLVVLDAAVAGPDLTLGDPVRPPRAHDRKGPILYIFLYKYISIIVLE
jgi:hypothetical protein